MSRLGTVKAHLAFHNSDPGTAALAGLVLGAPAALAVHTAQPSTRLRQPFISLLADFVTFRTASVALLAPLIIPVVLLLLVLGF